MKLERLIWYTGKQGRPSMYISNSICVQVSNSKCKRILVENILGMDTKLMYMYFIMSFQLALVTKTCDISLDLDTSRQNVA